MGFLEFLIILIVLPMMVAGVMPLIGRLSRRLVPDLIGNVTFFALFVYVIFVAKRLLGSNPAIVQQASWFNTPLNLSLMLDGFSLLMLLTVNMITFAVALYSIDYMEHYGAKANFYALLMLMVAGMNGLILTQDLFTMYVFLEVAAIASYALVAFGLEHDGLEAALKYLLLSAVASVLVLIAIAILFGTVGSLQFGDLAAAAQAPEMRGVIIFCSVLFLVGFGVKAAIVPFHAWLPDAHPSAPAPISAMLSGVLIKVSGVYAMFRIFYSVIGLTPSLTQIILWLGVISMFVGALTALGQTDMKRMLAYSSISQIGYVIIGLGLGTPLGVIGGLFHLFNHAIFKSLLFLNSGSVQYATGTRDLHLMGGLAKRMPITAATSAVGSLSIAGVPPLNGFWSKVIIIIALFQAKMHLVAWLAVIASVVTLWYYLILQRHAFFGKLNEAWSGIKEAPFWMSLSTILLGLLCIAVGLLFPLMINSWLKPAAEALTGPIQVALNFFGL